MPAAAEPAGELRRIVAVSGTAALFRSSALVAVSVGQLAPLDPAFGSYHEDLDLGLRLQRLGWKAGWAGGAPVRHAGSASGIHMRWRHPWWLLANRWRALAGNLLPGALARLLPRLLRGEIRALRTLARRNPRAILVESSVAAAWPALVARGWLRPTPGERLHSLPELP
jgi:GT2 family glycosyltransferase